MEGRAEVRQKYKRETTTLKNINKIFQRGAGKQLRVGVGSLPGHPADPGSLHPGQTPGPRQRQQGGRDAVRGRLCEGPGGGLGGHHLHPEPRGPRLGHRQGGPRGHGAMRGEVSEN